METFYDQRLFTLMALQEGLALFMRRPFTVIGAKKAYLFLFESTLSVLFFSILIHISCQTFKYFQIIWPSQFFYNFIYSTSFDTLKDLFTTLSSQLSKHHSYLILHKNFAFIKHCILKAINNTYHIHASNKLSRSLNQYPEILDQSL